uniref:Transmembrane protein n=1 Tax=Opuntia streptacantha TaxID=393608 RepID=A0A7C9ABV9_OPUST
MLLFVACFSSSPGALLFSSLLIFVPCFRLPFFFAWCSSSPASLLFISPLCSLLRLVLPLVNLPPPVLPPPSVRPFLSPSSPASLLFISPLSSLLRLVLPLVNLPPPVLPPPFVRPFLSLSTETKRSRRQTDRSTDPGAEHPTVKRWLPTLDSQLLAGREGDAGQDRGPATADVRLENAAESSATALVHTQSKGQM